ncbi:MAG: TonB-dependent receptor [Rikenellaceae bacterium]
MKRFLFLLFVLVGTLNLTTVFAEKLSSEAEVLSSGASIRGVVLSDDGKSPVSYGTVFIGDGSQIGTVTDLKGRFELQLPTGEYQLNVVYMGYEPYSGSVKVVSGEERAVKIVLKSSSVAIEGVKVRGESRASRVNKQAFNVQALEIGSLSNTTASLADGLSKMRGIRIREAGGVGSESKISLNGFSGNHVKIFIDGILQSGNAAFSLNNIPANFAERIEVYSGVAPIEFGADALGGIINIVSKKQNQAGWDVDASYSYGSFNTHRSNVTFTHQLDNGFQYRVNAYQNYSDNNYEIDNTVTLFSEGGYSSTPSTLYTVERFNDTYNNEAVIGEVGFRRKRWADFATLSVNYAKFYKEVQTGSRQTVVFGGRHREGHSLIPTLQYAKRDLLTKGLDIKANANYNYGLTMVIDTTIYNYNWFGDKQGDKSRSYTYRELIERSWNANGNAVYKSGEAHTMALSYSVNSAARDSRSATAGVAFDTYSDPMYTTKGITGLSYMYKHGDLFNAQAFGKSYVQINNGVTVDTEGVSTYRNERNGYWGYGAAGTLFFLDGFQGKLSYEKACRLPTTTELFGDADLELGNIGLKPERSDNYNINLTYDRTFGIHSVSVGGGLVYSDATDFIRRVVSTDGETSSTINHGEVETKGWSASATYNHGELFSLGGNLNALNARDNEPIDETTANASLTYGQRMPNEPYLYANADGRINFYGLFCKGDHLYIIYDLLYQHEFPLYWEAFGDADTKKKVPTQWAHNLTLHYTLDGGKYNFSLECKNIMDANLYDNFSLQKAGRAFYGKVRVNFGSVNKR